MSMQLILGNAGSGKSEYLYEYIIAEAASHPQQQYLVIVPEQFTMRTQREFVLRHKGHCILNIDILSFERLAYRVFDELGMNKTVVLDDTAKNLILRKVAISHLNELKILKKNVQKPGYVDEVKSLLSEMTQYNIMPEDLQEIIEKEEESIFKYKLMDIRTLYQGFLDFLQNRFVTGEELLTVLSEVVEKSGIVPGSVIAFDGFTGFTPVQLVLLEKLFAAAKKSMITVTVDIRDDYLTCKGIHDLFFLSKQTIASLYRIAGNSSVAIEEPVFMPVEEERRFRQGSGLEFLERNLYRNPPVSFSGKPEDITIAECRNPKEELRFAAAFIHKQVREKKYRYRDFAIVAGNVEEYGSHIEMVLGEFHVPYFLDVKKKISDNRLVECIRAYLKAGTEGFSYTGMFRFLKTGMTILSEEAIDELENYVLATRIRGYQRWRQPFTRMLKGMMIEDLGRINEARKWAISYFEGIYEELSGKKSAIVKLEALYTFLLRIEGEKQMKEMEVSFQEQGNYEASKEYGQIFRSVMELLDEYAELLGEDELDFEEFSEVLCAGFDSKKVGVIPLGNDRVIVGDIERTRLEHVKTLIFIGVNDGIIPRISQGSICLSQRERELLKGYHMQLAPSLKERAFIQQFYLYLIMTKPSEQLVITYGKMSNSGKTFCPSHLIGVMEKLFPQIKTGGKEKLLGEDFIVSEEGSFRYLAEGLQQPSEAEKKPLWIGLWNWFMTNGRWRSRALELLQSAFAEWEQEELEVTAANLLYGAEMYNSVTRLENFSKCAFSHFLSYGLKLKEREDGSFDPADMGTIFHNALFLCGQKLEGEGRDFSELSQEEGDELGEMGIRHALEQLGDTALMEDARSSYQINRMERILKRTIWAIGKQMQTEEYRPEAYEVPFQFIDNGEGVTYQLENGEKVNLVGRIDRIDTVKGEEIQYRVVDYKTGAVALNLSEIYYGLQLQLVVYLKAASRLLEQKYPEKKIIPSGMYYYHIDDPLVEAKRGETLNETQERILKELKMKGLEESENMKLLTDYVDKKIEEIGNRMIQGEIAPHPYRLGSRSGCDYCEYGSICRFRAGKEGCHMKQLETLKGEESICRMADALKKDQEVQNGNFMDRGTETGH